jgi:hypothetical protein
VATIAQGVAKNAVPPPDFQAKVQVLQDLPRLVGAGVPRRHSDTAARPATDRVFRESARRLS